MTSKMFYNGFVEINFLLHIMCQIKFHINGHEYLLSPLILPLSQHITDLANKDTKGVDRDFCVFELLISKQKI